MTVYSLSEINGNAGCYGVFSSEEKATAAAMEFIKSWHYDNVEVTSFDGFSKCIYYGKSDAYDNGGCFEICKHTLDNA